MFNRPWPSDQEQWEIQQKLNEFLVFVRHWIKRKKSPRTYLKCLWVQNQLAACQAALDMGNQREVQKLILEITLRVVGLYEENVTGK